MAILIECKDLDDNHPVIVNLDQVFKIVPIVSGTKEGSFIYFINGQLQKVADKYDQLKQFAIQPVSADDIAKINGRITTNVTKEAPPVADIIPTFTKKK
jgi:hypothetical protein